LLAYTVNMQNATLLDEGKSVPHRPYEFIEKALDKKAKFQ